MPNQFESKMPKYHILILNIDIILFNINGFTCKQPKWLEAIFFSTENLFMNILREKKYLYLSQIIQFEYALINITKNEIKSKEFYWMYYIMIAFDVIALRSLPP